MINMADVDVADVAAEVQKHLDSWNPPPDDSGVSRLVGEQSQVDASGPSSSKVDAGRPDLFPDAFSGQAGSAGGESDLPEVPTDEDGAPLYDDMSKKDLQAHLEARGLSQSGNKGDLVDRLEEDDAENAG